MFNREFQFTGKHADYIRALTTNIYADHDQKNRGVFLRNVDVLMVAPIIGVIFKRTSEKDNTNTLPAKINFEQLAFRNDDLKYLLALVLFNSDDSLSIDEKVQLTFKDTYLEDSEERIFLIFQSYLLGGVEYLYETIIKGAMSFDDMINNFQKFIDNFNMIYPADSILEESLFDQESYNE